MAFFPRTRDYLTAAALVIAFGGLFAGRLMIYPVATAAGGFLQRVAAKSDAWDAGHRVMLLGMVTAVPAALGLRRQLIDRAPWLTELATALTVLGATLGVGQYALDFAMLAAAQLEPRAGQQFLDALQGQPFVHGVFYKLPDAAQFGLILFTIAFWRQGPAWRVPAILLSLAAITSLVGPLFYGNWGVRAALGLWFVGFSAAAIRLVLARPSRTQASAA